MKKYLNNFEVQIEQNSIWGKYLAKDVNRILERILDTCNNHTNFALYQLMINARKCVRASLY